MVARRAQKAGKPAVDLAALSDVNPKELGIRFAFGAAISIVAGVVGSVFGARAGGMFLAFPAILPASLTLIEEKQGTRSADRDAYGAILGGVGLIAFAVVCAVGFGGLRAPVVVAVALAVWMAVSGAAYAVFSRARPEICRDE